MEAEIKIAVSSLGTSLDAWAGGPFGTCTQFLVVDTDATELVVISVPPEQLDTGKVRLTAIRALAQQNIEVIITGHIEDICRRAIVSLGIEVSDGIEGITVRDAVSLYTSGGTEAIAGHKPPPVKIAVASHGNSLDATLSHKGEACASFVLVDPQTMDFEVVKVEPADSPERASVNAVRAAAKSGATVVVTPEIRPACCTALRALAIQVVLADENLAVREAVEAYCRGGLASPSYL
jgi:predicted Fe-Mo cluster-binding NifX family protein